MSKQFLLFLFSSLVVFSISSITKAEAYLVSDLGDPFEDYPYAGSGIDYRCAYLGNVVKGVTPYYFWTVCLVYEYLSPSSYLVVGYGIVQYTRSSPTQNYVISDSRRWLLNIDPMYLPYAGYSLSYFSPFFSACFPIPFEVMYQDGDNALIFIATPQPGYTNMYVNVYQQQSSSLTLHSRFMNPFSPVATIIFPASISVLYTSTPLNNDYTVYTAGTYGGFTPDEFVFVYQRWSYTGGSWSVVALQVTDIPTVSAGACQLTKPVQTMPNRIIMQTSKATGTISNWFAADNSLTDAYSSSPTSSTLPDVIWSFGMTNDVSIFPGGGVFAYLLLNNFNGIGNDYQWIECSYDPVFGFTCTGTTAVSPTGTTPPAFTVHNAQLSVCSYAANPGRPFGYMLATDPSNPSPGYHVYLNKNGQVSNYVAFSLLDTDLDPSLGRMVTSTWLNTDNDNFIIGAPTAYQALNELGPGRLFSLTDTTYCGASISRTFPTVNETSFVTQLPDPFVGYDVGYSCYAKGTIVKAVRPLYFWTACVVVDGTGLALGIGVAQYIRPNTSATFTVNPHLRFVTLYEEGLYYSSTYFQPNQDAAWPLTFHVADNNQTSAWIYLASIDPATPGNGVGRIYVYLQDNNATSLYDVVLPLVDDWSYYPLSLDWLDTQSNTYPNLVASGIAGEDNHMRYEYIVWPGGIATVSGTFDTQDPGPAISVGALIQRRVYVTSQAVYFRYSIDGYTEWFLSTGVDSYATCTYLDPLAFPLLSNTYMNFALRRQVPDANFPNSVGYSINGLFYTNQYTGTGVWNFAQQQGVSPRVSGEILSLGLDQTIDSGSVTPAVHIFDFGNNPANGFYQLLIAQPRLSPPQLQLVTMPSVGSVPILQTLYFPNIGSSSTSPWLGSMRTTSHVFLTNNEIVLGAPNFNNGAGALFQIQLLNITVPPPVQPPVSPPVSPPMAPPPTCPPIPPIPPIPPPIVPQPTFSTFLGLPFAYHGEIVEFTRALAATSDHVGIAVLGRALYNNRSVALTYYQPWNQSLAYQLVGIGGEPPVGPVLSPIAQTTTGANWGTVRLSDDRQLLLIGAPVMNESIYLWQYDQISDSFHLQQTIETPAAYSSIPGGVGQAFDLSRDGFTFVYIIENEVHLLRWSSLNTSSNASIFEEVQLLPLPDQINLLSMDGYGRCVIGSGMSVPRHLYILTTGLAAENPTGLLSLNATLALGATFSDFTAITISADCSSIEVSANDLSLSPPIGVPRRLTSAYNSITGTWSAFVVRTPAAMSSLYLSDLGSWEASVPVNASSRFAISHQTGTFDEVFTVPDPTVNQTGSPAIQYVPVTTKNGFSSNCQTLIAGQYKTDFPTLAGTGQGQIVIYSLPQSVISCQPTPVLPPFIPPPPPPTSPPVSPPVNPPVTAPFLPPLFAPVLFPPQAPSVIIVTPSQFTPTLPTSNPVYVTPTSPIVLMVFYIFVVTAAAAVVFWIYVFVRRGVPKREKR